MNPDTRISFTPSRRWKIGFNVALSVFLLGAIVLMVNFISARHYSRWHLEKASDLKLSPLTLRILETLTNDVQVIVYFDRRQPLYGAVRDLLGQYEAVSRRIQVEEVDYIHYPGRAQAVKEKYLPGKQATEDSVIFHSNGKTHTVLEKELSVFDMSGIMSGKEIRRTAFKGEQLFSSAIYSVVNPEQPQAFFLSGHGEHDPEDGDDERGYFRFAELLRENNVAVEQISLLTNAVPEQCSLLIIAAPRHPLAPIELDRIQKYLNQGGRLLALFSFENKDVRTGLELLLASWGVQVGQNYVIDKVQSKSGENEVLITSQFGSHALVNPLLRSRLLLVLPRSISKKENGPQSADAPKVEELVFTSQEGLALATLDDERVRIVRQGTIPLMAAVEKGSIQGVTANLGMTRIVVCGESLFLGNQIIGAEANREFAKLATNWLLDRDVLLEDIGPRPITEYRVNLTTAQKQRLWWIMVPLMPGSILLVGLAVWWRRRG